MISGIIDRVRQARGNVGIRVRSALLAAIAVAITLAIGTLVLLGLFRNRLEANLDQSLLQQAADRALLLDAGADPSGVIDVLQDESMVWIGTEAGETLAVSGAIKPLQNPVPDVIGGATTIELLVEEQHGGIGAGDDDADSDSEGDGEDEGEGVETERMALRIASSASASGPIVIVGAERETIDKAVAQLASLFAAAVPLVVLLVGVLTWLTTGRALQPVERIRRQANEVSGTNLSERVPVPETGDEVNRLALTMNEMLSRLEDHQRSLHRFTADASHELKSPVANLRAIVDTAEISDAAWPELARHLTTEADRLRDLVDNLLFLATKADQVQTATTLVHLDDLLFDEAELLSATGRVAVTIDQVTPTSIEGNHRDLQRLVRNLVDNAARHASTTVALACGESNSGVFLRVADDGAGIPEADRERVFERFTRLDDARARDTGGSGLGLPIVRRIVDDHGGVVDLEETPGGGVLVDVRFPEPQAAG